MQGLWTGIMGSNTKHSRPFCDYRHRGRGFCVCKAYGRESQLKSKFPSQGFASIRRVYCILLFSCYLSSIGRKSRPIPSCFRRYFASIKKVYGIPATFSLFPHVGRKSAAQRAESGHFLRPNRSYTVYLNIPLIFHQLDADSVPEPAADPIYLRPNSGYTVY